MEKAKIEALVRAWIEDGEIRLRPIGRQPTLEEKRDPRFCLFHRNVNHPTTNCYLIRRIYHNKVQLGDIEEVEKNPLTNYRKINTCTTIELDLEPIIEEEFRGCSESLTQEAKVVDSLMKTRVFKNLFETLEFDEQAQKEAATTIVEISKRFGEQCCVISRVVGKMARQSAYVKTLKFEGQTCKIPLALMWKF